MQYVRIYVYICTRYIWTCSTCMYTYLSIYYIYLIDLIDYVDYIYVRILYTHVYNGTTYSTYVL